MTGPTPTHLPVPTAGSLSTKKSNESIRGRIRSTIRSLSPTPPNSASGANASRSPSGGTSVASVVFSLGIAPIGSAMPGVILNLANAVPAHDVTPNHTIATNIFSTNSVARTEKKLHIPKISDHIVDTLQLALCVRLLSDAENTLILPASSSNVISRAVLSDAQREWVQSMNDLPLIKECLEQLVNRVVTQFISETSKDVDFIYEVVLLGPVLAKSRFRTLLHCFEEKLNKSGGLNIEMLWGLAQLVHDAPEGHLQADDMIQILSSITSRLEDPRQQSREHSNYLVLAATTVLNVMADNKVKDLDRESVHTPLIKVLTRLKSDKDPFLQYRASYALLALELVPDNESAWMCGVRLVAGVIAGALKMSGVFNHGYDGIPEGATAMWNGAQRIVDSARHRYKSGDLRECYLAIRGIEVFIQGGHLSDLNEYICKESCRDDPLFQWGVCEVLGRIAVDGAWDDTTRGQALMFLKEIFKANVQQIRQPDVRCLVLTILKQIADSSVLQSPFTGTESVKSEASRLFLELKSDDIQMSQHPYTFLDRLPLPRASLLLKKIDSNPDLELVLGRLRRQRLSEYGVGAVYVQAFSKESLQAFGEDLVLLKTRADSFLNNKREVMLILGESGAGKSTFNRRLEYELWEQYKTGDAIPLFIDLKSVRDPDNDMIQQQLIHYGVRQMHIDEMRQSRKIILICDGYDECRKWSNLHTNNWLNKANHWSAKMVITCRSQYLRTGYRQHFEPQPTDDYSEDFGNKLDLFEEAVIVSFNMDQIESYIDQFISLPETVRLFGERPVWTSKLYLDKLKTIPQLMDLIKNPFLLRLMLNVLPTVTDASTLAGMTRVQLYDKYVTQHFEHERKRLGGQLPKMNQDDHNAFDALSQNFIGAGIKFAASLSDYILKEQEGVNAVKYSPDDKEISWKTKFFGMDPEVKLLRYSSPLVRSGIRHEFTHRSIMEYFFTCRIFDPRTDTDGDNDTGNSDWLSLSACLKSTARPSPLACHPLNQRNIVIEPSIVHFLAERVQQSAKFKDQLHTIITLSKSDKDFSQAASNAITILVKSGEQFNGADLREIKIPGANLAGGHFDSAQLQDADLTEVNLSETWLRQADFSRAIMTNVKFTEKPYQCFPGGSAAAISRNRKLLGFGFTNGRIEVLDTQTWITSHVLREGSKVVSSVAFSADGVEIAAGYADGRIRIWNIQDRAVVHVLTGHFQTVTQVAYSPDGRLLGSCSVDSTVKIWDVSSMTIRHTLCGHTGPVVKIAWSHDGLQLASSDNDPRDKTIRLWSTATGKLEQKRHIDSKFIICFAYAPNGSRIAVGAEVNVVQLDSRADSGHCVIGSHTGPVLDVAYSPEGHWIASASFDGTVRIWDSYTGVLKGTLSEHEGAVRVVLFLSEQQVLAIGQDSTVRFWTLGNTEVKSDMMDGVTLIAAQAHKGPVGSVTYSSGDKLVSIGADNTIREWDARTGSSRVQFESQDPFTSSTVSPEGNRITVVYKEGIRTYDRDDGLTFTALGEILLEHTNAKYSPCNRWLALGDNTGRVRLLDRVGGAKERILATLHDPVIGLRFSRCGKLLFSISKGPGDQFPSQLNDTETGQPIAFNAKNVSIMEFSPCLTMIAWNPIPDRGSDAGYRQENIGPIHILKLASGDELAVLKGHVNLVTSIAWTLNWIASGSRDQTVRLWKKTEAVSNNGWTCVATLKDFAAIISTIDWNPISPFELVTGSFDNSVCVWNVFEDDAGKVQVSLKWRSTDRFRLVSTGARIAEAEALDKDQRKLLLQHGAIDQSAAVSLQQELTKFIEHYRLMEDTVKNLTLEFGDVNTSASNDLLDEELRKLRQHDQPIIMDEYTVHGIEAELKPLLEEQIILDTALRQIAAQIREVAGNNHPSLSTALPTFFQRLRETDESLVDNFKEEVRSLGRRLATMERAMGTLLQHFHGVDTTDRTIIGIIGRFARSVISW